MRWCMKCKWVSTAFPISVFISMLLSHRVFDAGLCKALAITQAPSGVEKASTAADKASGGLRTPTHTAAWSWKYKESVPLLKQRRS